MRLKVCCGLLLTWFGWSHATSVQAQISNPVIPGISVEISDVLQFPDTRGQGAEDGRVSDSFARINFMREIPGSPGEWFVNDLRGEIYRVNPATQQINEYLDVGDVFSRFIIGSGGLSTGLITITPHPEFATTGKFYTIHEESAFGNPATPDFQAVNDEGEVTSGQHGVVTEWTVTDPTASTFSGTHREIMRILQPQGNLHNLGDIGFNPLLSPGDPDYGMMYISGGDGGYDAYGKGDKQAQHLNSIFGKLLRIDPTGNNSGNGAYGIPADNPYASDGDSSTLGEIYASGFRNLHRISWDLQTDTFLGTDIGQSKVEEVNILDSGGNYGWSTFEGTFLRGGGTIPAATDTDPYTWPVVQYDHDEGNAIAGGFVYRGTQIPELQGKFVFGDIVTGRLFYSDFADMVAAHEDGDYLTTADIYELFLTRDGEAVTMESLESDARGGGSLPNGRVDMRIAQTADGELYLLSKQDGFIRQLLGPGVAGDFDGDGDVDGTDFLLWQRGESPHPMSTSDLSDWQENYGAGGNLAIAVPEPATWLLLLLSGLWRGGRLQRNRG